jgi:hypothetical protein
MDFKSYSRGQLLFMQANFSRKTAKITKNIEIYGSA